MGLVASAFGVVTVIAAVILVVVLLRRRPVTAVAREGRDLVAGVPATPATILLLERWRDRAAGARRGVAVPAVVGAIVAGVVLRQQLAVSVGAHPAWTDPLLAGLLGAFLGAIVAELHHLRPAPGKRRAARLRPRDVGPLLPPGARPRLVLLVTAAAAASLGAVLVADLRVPALGLGALLLASLVPLVQRGIVVRRQPAMPAPLRQADDAVRQLAVRSVDRAGAGAILLLTAWQLAPVYSAVTVPEPLQVLLAALQLGAAVLAVLWWRRSNPVRLLPDVPAALTSRESDDHAEASA